MKLQNFLDHWAITENPFLAEEARDDPVFSRLGAARSRHPDFDKILGDLHRPSTAVVFGEKGSGKTAIRLQIADAVREHNQEEPEARVAIISYDELNPVLDHFCARVIERGDAKPKDIAKALSRFRLVDHMDAILHAAVPQLVDAILAQGHAQGVSASRSAVHALRRGDAATRRDAMLLAAVYDQNDEAADRIHRLRRRIRGPINTNLWLWRLLAATAWLVPAAVVVAAVAWRESSGIDTRVWIWAFLITLALWGLILAKHLLWDRWMLLRLARSLAREARAVPRNPESWADALEALPPRTRDRATLPVTDVDETRYAMFARFRAVIRALGYRGALIVVDRVDEPTLINGDAERMRAVIWPLFNNKFLQQEGLGIKLLLPVELRHELFRESAAFFQEARLDKQNLVERLSWTGAMLHDLCTSRLNACRAPGAEPIGLTDLFAEDVTRQDVVDALEQMHQPRDAFKLLYRCMQEHCSNVTDEQPLWKIPRLVLETVRKQESERVQMFYRGIRPA